MRKIPEEVVSYVRRIAKGRSNQEITKRVQKRFGDKYTLKMIISLKKNHKISSGLDGRFPKGHLPHNKGKKGICAKGCEKTWFKKGQAPPNKKPIGSLRVAQKNGRIETLLIKLTEDKQPSRDNWVSVAKLFWEEVNGPLPDGHVLYHLDGDASNCMPDNLMPVTKRVSAIVNSRYKVKNNEVDLNRSKIIVSMLRDKMGELNDR